MSPDPRYDIPSEYPAAEAVRRSWGWLLALGIMQLIAGTVAVAMSIVATFAMMLVLGVLALFGAGAEVASVFWSRRWEEGIVHLIIGLLYGAFGVLILANPGLAAVTLTLVLAVMLIGGGVFRVVLAATGRFHGWGWALLGGVVSILLGGLIWADWPAASLWVIGLFVGIDLIFLGWKWVAVALALRGAAPRAVAYPRDVPPVIPAG